MPKRALTFSRGIHRIPYLASLLGVESAFWSHRLFRAASASDLVCVVGWGRKRNTLKARRYATARGLPYLALEDGFLRSVGLGVQGDPPLSVVVDDMGIYYDARQPSRLEHLLNGEPVADLPGTARHGQSDTGVWIDPLLDRDLLARARSCMTQMQKAGLSKYNSSPNLTLPPADRPRVLVVDQTAGDLSIGHGLARPDSFRTMLDAALREHPGAEILIKIHPDVIAGKKQGHLQTAATHPRVRLLDSDSNPVHLVRQVEQVYVVSSLTGFEALLAGTPVTCFGAPFYAGWGLTDDRIAIARRRQRRSVEQVFAAAYLLYARYRHPHTGLACEIEPVIEYLALQRRYFSENAGDLYCYGFTLWKRGYVRRYLQCPWNRVRFIRTSRLLRRPGSMGSRGSDSVDFITRRALLTNAKKSTESDPLDPRLVVWGMREPEWLHRLAEHQNIPLWRMEDGFLRSVGLGSDLIAPVSLVLDRQGIYFDPALPSELEEILQNGTFPAQELAQARRLRENIVSLGLSKYNVGQSQRLSHGAGVNQRVILVPGQVEDDASIERGCPDIRSNAGLLRAVRAQAPDAWIIYKPHPDVLSGNRDGLRGTDQNAGYDQLVTDIGIVQCLEAADEVHTMTSLVGFEGLLRGKRVVTYGLPFYAGWGLTSDRHTLTRRNRKLLLDELVAGSLIRYPRYLDLGTGRFTTAEAALADLAVRLSTTNHNNIFLPLYHRLARRLMNLLNGIFYAR